MANPVFGTPSPTPSPAPQEKPSISAEINAATRKQHAELNRLIVERLFLALPPHTHTPHFYGIGLAAFTQLFIAFESVFADLESDVAIHDKAGYDGQVRAWLGRLRPKGLLREDRLRDDQSHVRDVTRKNISTHERSITEVVMPLRARLEAKPHLLIAYAWVLYMAIFSGGRWIREQLGNAGPGFWLQSDDIPPPHLDRVDRKAVYTELPGFSFLSFDGTEDGEDIKRDFKKRLAQAETLLTDDERHEVVDAAQQLFGRCIAMVGELDREVERLKTPPLHKALLALLFFGLLTAFGIYRVFYLGN